MSSGDASFSWTLPPGPPLTEAQRALVVEGLPVARLAARRFVHGWPTARQYRDELPSVAYEGLIRAAQRFRPGGNSWLSYAYGGAFMQCRAWLQAMQVRATESLDAPVREGADVSRLELHADPSESPEAATLRRQVLQLVERLPERERTALQRHLDGRRLEDVAAERGCTRAAVHLWERAAVDRLRLRLGLPKYQREKKKPAPVSGPERLRAILADGTPRTTRELTVLTGYTRQGLRTTLRRLGAVQVGAIARRGAEAPLWALPERAT